jgi:hypothetical protein
LLVGEPFVALLAVVHEHVSDGEGCGDSTDDCWDTVSVSSSSSFLDSCLSPLGSKASDLRHGVAHTC